MKYLYRCSIGHAISCSQPLTRSRGQGTYYAHTGSRVTLERFDRVPARLERIA